MTERELSKLYYLKKLIARNEEKLRELEARALPGAARLTGMPRSPSPKNGMEETIVMIADLREKIEKENAAYRREKEAIEQYIKSIDDYFVRLIISYRFVDLLSWTQVALRVGGNNTPDSVRMAFSRYIRKRGRA